MTLEAVLGRLQGVRRNGSGWKALCPAHADHNPSLSVRENNGKILLHCFAGCTVEAICDALKIKVANLFLTPGVFQQEPTEVREAQKHIQNLRSRLTPRERILPVTIVCCGPADVEAGIAWALALAVEGEIVQAVLEERE